MNIPATTEKGLDLYVFRDGKWSVHHNYLKTEKDKALEDAENLQKKGGYVGICLVNHKSKKIIFNYNTRGDKLTYSIITTGGTGYVPIPDNSEIRTGKIIDKSSKNNTPVSTLLPLFVALISLVSGGVMAKFISDNGGTTFSLAIAVTVLGVTLSFILYLKQVRGDINEQSRQVKESAKKWQKIEAVVNQSLAEFQQYSLNDEGNEMVEDSYFGMILLAIGMGEGAAEHANFTKEEVEEKIVDILNKLELSEDGVKRTWANIYEYLAYPKYKRIYDKGSYIVKTCLENLPNDIKIQNEVEIWLGRSVEKEIIINNKVASVLFTDIVDFTGSQQRFGDEWLVDVVKAHNEIVRVALKSFQGKEVKHTGDGVMASFPSSVLAANASLAMQHGFIKFSDAAPTRAFEVRIGISAGEPIHMGDDIFGAPVNMAARVMSHGDGGDIMFTGEAYEICKNIDGNFDKVSDCKLEGFEGDYTLYKIKCAKEKIPPKEFRKDVGASFSGEKTSSFLKDDDEHSLL